MEAWKLRQASHLQLLDVSQGDFAPSKEDAAPIKPADRGTNVRLLRETPC